MHDEGRSRACDAEECNNAAVTFDAARRDGTLQDLIRGSLNGFRPQVVRIRIGNAHIHEFTHLE